MYFKHPFVFRGPVLFFVSIITLVAEPLSAFSHGFAGNRFFPATITTDDPFAASELSLPTFSEIRQPGQPPVKVFDLSADLSLLVLPRTALTIGDGYSIQKVADQRAQTGFDNADLHILYEFFENDKHEAITSGMEVDKRDARVDQSNAALLTVSLAKLKAGKYRVVWRVVSVDAHVTTGDFAFELTRS